MKENQNYSIKDISGYSAKLRELAMQDLDCPLEASELDSYITIPQVEHMIIEECDEFNNQDEPIVNLEIHSNICANIITRITNCCLSKMCAADSMECAFDDKINDFIFWVKDTT